jgi:hypothetical protein
VCQVLEESSQITPPQQEGQKERVRQPFIDNEHVDVYVIDRYIPISSMTLQAAEVDEVKYIHIDVLESLVSSKVRTCYLSALASSIDSSTIPNQYVV